MSTNDIPVLVVGNHVTSLNIMRQLGRRKINCYLTHKSSSNISRYSKYCKGFFKSPSFTNIDEMTAFLLRLGDNPRLKNAILVPTNDDCVIVLSQKKKILEDKFIVPLPRWELVNRAFDKRLTLSLAEKAGLPIPKPIYPTNRKDMLNQIYKLEFPVVIKPAMGKKYYFASGTKMHMANNIDECCFYFDKIAAIMGEDNIIVQEYIPGPMDELYNYSTVMKGGKPYGIFTGKKLRQHPRDFGVGTAAQSVNDPELIRVGTELLRACEYEGIGYVEFKKDLRDGLYKLIEINPRLWNFMDLANALGVDLPWNLYCYATNQPIEEKIATGHFTWIHFWTDFGETFKEVLKGREGFKEYFHSLKGRKKIYAVASWSDPLPFIFETIMLPYLLLRR
ncbi:MAG: hypothetical protein JXC36_03935 [Candidatus Atribacteria bacterium]|nr:hypothetical protein [Candidatus Atribacteria bacterium]